MIDQHQAFLQECVFEELTIEDADAPSASRKELDRLYVLVGWVTGVDMKAWMNQTSTQRDQVLKKLSYRFAPSIITRSEGELFGISTPRFAIRATITDDNGRVLGFVNLRRIKSFVKSIQKSLGYHPKDFGTHSVGQFESTFPSVNHALFSSIRGRCRSFADACLDPSMRYPKHSVIVSNLADGYDEIDLPWSMPFATHFPIGGGMCAQAVCFQANSLMHQWAKGVFGVSEISYLASSRDQSSSALADDVSFLDFSGLRAESIERFFSHPLLNLSSFRHSFKNHIPARYDSEFSRFKTTLKSYVHSGIPTIVAVNFEKYRTIKKNIGDIPGYYFPSPGSEGHALLVVGCDESGDGFLVNDPASLPFIEYTAKELFSCLASHENVISVMPRWVQHPLTSAMSSETQLGHFPYDRSRREIGHSVSSDWYLDAGEHPVNEVMNRPAWIEVAAVRVKEFRGRCPDLAKTPLWVERTREDVRVWKAGIAFENPLIPKRTMRRRPCPVLESEPLPKTPPQVSVLTSFSPKRAIDAAQSVNDWCDYPCAPLELYLWMQPDVNKIRERVGAKLQSDPETAATAFNCEEINGVEMMSIHSTGDVQRALDYLPPYVRDNVLAIATYIPEISADPESEQGQHAQRALKYVFEFAKRLQGMQPADRKVRVIEFVAGSRIDGVYMKMGAQRYPELVTRIVPDPVAQSRVICNLNRAASTPGKECDWVWFKELYDLGITLAVELEPGPLFIVRDLSTLKQFFKEVVNHEVLQKTVGANLDIAHWRLAHITPQDAESQHENDVNIKSRIVHCHMSGHHINAHFGDRELTDDDRPGFDEWKTVLLNRAKDQTQPKFSGLISLEYEVARDVNSVRRSFHRLQSWLP